MAPKIRGGLARSAPSSKNKGKGKVFVSEVLPSVPEVEMVVPSPSVSKPKKGFKKRTKSKEVSAIAAEVHTSLSTEDDPLVSLAHEASKVDINPEPYKSTVSRKRKQGRSAGRPVKNVSDESTEDRQESVRIDDQVPSVPRTSPVEEETLFQGEFNKESADIEGVPSSSTHPPTVPNPVSSSTDGYFSPEGIHFESKNAADRWLDFKDRKIIFEHKVDLSAVGLNTDFLDCMDLAGLRYSLENIAPPIENLVREFYCNMQEDIVDPSGPMYGKVFVRGSYINFTPDVIRAFLKLPYDPHMVGLDPTWDQIATELTGGARSSWPSEVKDIPAADLFGKYKLIHKVTIKNWLPSFQRTSVWKSLAQFLYNMGTGDYIGLEDQIFAKVTQLAGISASRQSLVYPSLITGLLLSQGITPSALDVPRDVPSLFLLTRSVGTHSRGTVDLANMLRLELAYHRDRIRALEVVLAGLPSD